MIKRFPCPIAGVWWCPKFCMVNLETCCWNFLDFEGRRGNTRRSWSWSRDESSWTGPSNSSCWWFVHQMGYRSYWWGCWTCGVWQGELSLYHNDWQRLWSFHLWMKYFRLRVNIEPQAGVVQIQHNDWQRLQFFHLWVKYFSLRVNIKLVLSRYNTTLHMNIHIVLPYMCVGYAAYCHIKDFSCIHCWSELFIKHTDIC